MKILSAAMLLIACAAPAAAGCRLALAIGMDVSASIDETEYRLQRQGMAGALLSPRVQSLLFASEEHWVAIAVYEWSADRFREHNLVDWTALRGPDDLARVAQSILTAPEADTLYATALGWAVVHGWKLHRRVPDCRRHTLDISGDGRNNHSYPPKTAYREFPFDGMTVNGLAILGEDPDIFDYFVTEVIRGPGAFVEVANGYADFEAAMRRKLERELEGPVIGMLAPEGPG